MLPFDTYSSQDDDAYDLSSAALATCDLSSTFDDLPQSAFCVMPAHNGPFF